MLIAIGSKNPVKMMAVLQTLADYPELQQAYGSPGMIDAHTVEVESGVAEQPMTLEATLRGAKNRAIRALAALDAKRGRVDSALGFGIESGLMSLPDVDGYMEYTTCVISDRQRFHHGISAAFKLPEAVSRVIEEHGVHLSEATRRAGLTDDPHIGSGDGIIGLLTGGRVTRLSYTITAVQMALIGLR